MQVNLGGTASTESIVSAFNAPGGPKLKQEGNLTATIKANGDKGTFEAIMSVPSVDRDGEVVDAKAFEPLPDHITIDIDHGMSVEKTVGSGRPYYDGDLLKIDGSFASTPLAQTVRTLVKEGHIRTMSVAYRDAVYETDEKDGLPHLRSAELLNAAIVGIPANRDALITAAKEAKVGARNAAKDAERIQGAHDILVELGADCSGKSHAADSTKSTDVATDPETTAVTETAVDPLADVALQLALAELSLAEADLT